jgi:uncharacterized protein
MAIQVDEPGLQALVYGGAVLGGGGGGSLAVGLESVREILAMGVPRVLPLAAMEDDAILATLSAVGSASGTSGEALTPAHFKRALALFESFSNHPVEGYLASEVGPRSVTYGLRESINSGIPVIDAPANGRSHPLFVMGSLGLHLRPRRATTTVAVGGVVGSSKYIEMAIRANVTTAARVVRDRAARASIPLAVIRNPLPAAVVRHHAAVGALAFAQRVGRILLAELTRGPAAVLSGLTRLMGGRVLATGRVRAARLSERQGFSVGVIKIRCADGSELGVPVCNEFMAVLRGGRPLVGFPDLIALFDRETGLPLASPEVCLDHRLAVFVVPRQRLLLGSPMDDRRLLRPVERLLGLPILSKSAVAV